LYSDTAFWYCILILCSDTSKAKFTSVIFKDLARAAQLAHSTSILKIIQLYRGADKSLARPTSRLFCFNGENISFDASLVIYKNSNNIPPIMIIIAYIKLKIVCRCSFFLVGLRTYQHPCIVKWWLFFTRSLNIPENKFVGIMQSYFVLIFKMRKVTVRPSDNVSNVTDICQCLCVQLHRTTTAELCTPKAVSQFS
jgi:hypothetical protein